MSKDEILLSCFHVLRAGGKIELAEGRIVLDMSRIFLAIRVRSNQCIWHKHLYKPTMAGMYAAFTNISLKQLTGKVPVTRDPFLPTKVLKALDRVYRKNQPS